MDAPPTREQEKECSVCWDETTVAIWIGDSPVCATCVEEEIVKKFVACLSHEAAYPVTWGATVLKPTDFLRFIEDAKGFMVVWDQKVREYETPVRARIYCKCGAFLGSKDNSNALYNCARCEKVLCAACGGIGPHPGGECDTPEEGNPFEGLTRGKDYQLCPNEKCEQPLELKDGCNAMRCQSAGCQTEVCFVCGLAASHDSQHYQAGGCPRWNQPGSNTAHFDRAVAPGPPPATAAAIIDRLGGNEEPRHFLFGVLLDLPALPPMPRLVVEGEGVSATFQRLIAEERIRAELLATEFGRLMTHYQGQVDAMIQVVQGLLIDAAEEHRARPAWLDVASVLLIKIRMNLDMLVFRERVAADAEQYRRRHEDIHRLYRGEHGRRITRQFPTIVEAKLICCYMTVMIGV